MSTSLTRLGSANTYDNATRNLSTRQSALSTLQENLTSGKRVVRASDDPTAAAQAERALTRISRIATEQRALESQRNSISMAESTLGDVTDALQNFRELVVSAGNGVHTAAERKSIAVQLTGLRDQIFSLSNRKDTNGLPLFSALGSALAPFVGPQATAPDYTFDGLPGQSSSGETAIPFALDGDSAFIFQDKRDGVYNASVNTVTPSATAVPPYGYAATTTNPVPDAYKNGNRPLNTSALVATTPGLVTGDSYSITFSAVGAGATPGTSTATYTLTNTNPAAAVAPITVTVPDFSSSASTTIDITGVPGMSFSITGVPANGDTITMDAKASLFSVLDTAIQDIGSAKNNNAATQAVAQALNNIDVGMGRVSAIRGQAGDLLNRADRITANQDKRSIQLEADRSRAEDLDMVKGISDFQNQQTGYSAALQSYAQVQKLSLFNYIS
jgi:flagellar hook-associated protein 3 FlgL